MAIYDVAGTTLSYAFECSGSELQYAYKRNGSVIYSDEPYEPQLTFLKTIPMSAFNPNKIISPQGMAVFGNYIAQYFTEDDSLRLIDMTDWTIDGSYELSEFVHGNGLIFGKNVQQGGFPLLYGSQFGTSQQDESKRIAIADIGISTYSIRGYYDIPSSAGYHPQFVADWDSNKAYTVSYPQTTTGSGDMIISEFDIDDMETIVKQWTVPYMGVVQGSCFWNGYIVVVGDSTNYSNVKISFVNVLSHQKTEFQFAKQQNHAMEFQGIDVVGNDLLISSWIYDDNDNQTLKYWLYKLNLPQDWQTIESAIVT